ncbi:glycosyltransferase [Alteromonas sediminis]|uniref:Glycosyltransferase n=2 Tax=Alteromonas sediminis TaxID=2259342 RepID=A0A3N5ZEI8_9ALTE|nr:glycosyltransferase [Alteromonas sediminis]RPJ68828.1 glycosyltransferase [Alteromonas sediminis]
MAVYAGDRLDWVTSAVESILAQSYRDFLFVIVVDGVVDDAIHAFIEQTQNENANVVLFKGTQNVGLSQCMNYVIEHVLKQWPDIQFFFRMDADDISVANRLANQVAFFKQHNDVDVLGSSLVEINEHGKIVGQRLLPLHHEQILKVLPRRCALNHPTVGVRMSVFAQGHRYRSELMNTQDYFLWIELCAKGFKFANLADTLLEFRRVNDFYKRRGLNKSLNEFKARFFAMKALNSLTLLNVTYAFAVILLRVMPARLIKLAYKIDRFFLNR